MIKPKIEEDLPLIIKEYPVTLQRIEATTCVIKSPFDLATN